MRIGIFDSGAGGLSVVKSILERHLFDEIIYYGDTARVPYGTKDKNTIIRYSLEALEFFNNFDIDLLITACNTVSAYALKEMREVSSYDIVGVIEAGIIDVQNKLIDNDDQILVIATKATIASNRYQNELKDRGYNNIISIQTGLFVPLVEEGIRDGAILDEVMNYYFKDLPQPKAIILGCTHFPLISTPIENYFKIKPKIIHSGEAIVEYLENTYTINNKSPNTNLKIFASDNVNGLRDIAKDWLSDSLFV
ncbi:Glutamate racemase [hydrothermal vent metagenome]|uniref:glutamate racemase n=1 Tax=hydrothermal vent metagenome TaxID=652676 RepID=A0A1W1BJ21_9ZZZZ